MFENDYFNIPYTVEIETSSWLFEEHKIRLPLPKLESADGNVIHNKQVD